MHTQPPPLPIHTHIHMCTHSDGDDNTCISVGIYTTVSQIQINVQREITPIKSLLQEKLRNKMFIRSHCQFVI